MELRPATFLVAVLLIISIAYSGASCIIQKADTGIRVTETYDQDTGQLTVNAKLTYTNLDTGQTSGLGQKELEFVVNYTTVEGEKSDKFKAQTDSSGRANVNFVIRGATKHTVEVTFGGDGAFKESKGTVGGSGKSETSFETNLPEGINLVTCMPLLLLIGFLGAAMYASGRNPFGMVDFTAPRGMTTQRRVMKAFQAGFASIFTGAIGMLGGVLGAIATKRVGAEKEEAAIKEGKKGEEAAAPAAPGKEAPKGSGRVEGVGGPIGKGGKKAPAAAEQKPVVAAPPVGTQAVITGPKAAAAATETINIPNVKPVVSFWTATLGFTGVILSALGGNPWAAMGMSLTKVIEKDENGKEVTKTRIVTGAMQTQIGRKVREVWDRLKTDYASTDKDGNAIYLIFNNGKWEPTTDKIVKEKLDAQKTKFMEEKGKLEGQKVKNKEKIAELEKILGGINGTIDSLKAKITEEKKNLAEKNDTLEGKQKEEKGLNNQKGNLEEKKADLKKQIVGPVKGETKGQKEGREEKNANIQKEIGAIDDKLNKVDVSRAAVNKEISKLEVDITSTEKTIKTAVKELAKQDVDAERTKLHIERTEKNNEGIEGQLKDNKRNIARTDDAIKMINDQMAMNKVVFDKTIKDVMKDYEPELEKLGIKEAKEITPAVLDKLVENAKKEQAEATTKEAKAELGKLVKDLAGRTEILRDAMVESQKVGSAAFIVSESNESSLRSSEILRGRGEFLCSSTPEEVAKAYVAEKAKAHEDGMEALRNIRESIAAIALPEGKKFEKLSEEEKRDAIVKTGQALENAETVAAKYFGKESKEAMSLASLREDLQSGNVSKVSEGIAKLADKMEPTTPAMATLKEIGAAVGFGTASPIDKIRNDLAAAAVSLSVGVEPGKVVEHITEKRAPGAPPVEMGVVRELPYPGGIDAVVKAIFDPKSANYDPSIGQNAQRAERFNDMRADSVVDAKAYTQASIAELPAIYKLKKDLIIEPYQTGAEAKSIATAFKENPVAAEAIKRTMGLPADATPQQVADEYIKGNKNPDEVKRLLNPPTITRAEIADMPALAALKEDLQGGKNIATAFKENPVATEAIKRTMGLPTDATPQQVADEYIKGNKNPGEVMKLLNPPEALTVPIKAIPPEILLTNESVRKDAAKTFNLPSDAKVAEIMDEYKKAGSAFEKINEKIELHIPITKEEETVYGKAREKTGQFTEAIYGREPKGFDDILRDAAHRDYGGFKTQASSVDNAVKDMIHDARTKTVGKYVVADVQEKYYEVRKVYEDAKDSYNELQNKNAGESDLKKAEDRVNIAKAAMVGTEKTFDSFISTTGGDTEGKKKNMKSDSIFEDWKREKPKFDKEVGALQNPNYLSFRLKDEDKTFGVGVESKTYGEVAAGIKFADALNSCSQQPSGISKLSKWMTQR